ncbi:MAG TPA: lysoplasmalogenase [Sediminibacterium sp.]|nr:lysoplasmalogenase [Sediminibacterium sp.]
MRSFQKYLLAVFLVVLVLHLFAIRQGWPDIRFVTKLSLSPLLCVVLLLSKPVPVPVLNYLALISSFLGDWLLTRTGDIYFLGGMLAFLLTHFCNIIFLIQLQGRNFVFGKAGIRAAVLLWLFDLLIYLLLKSSLGIFEWPVILYICVISVFALLAATATQSPDIGKAARNWLLPGAVLFVLSDTLLALNQFGLHLLYLDMPVMALYGLAQMCLTLGYIAVARDRQEKITFNA